MGTLVDVLKGGDDSAALLVSENGPQLSRAAVRGAVEKLAVDLAGIGVQPGETVSLAETNTLEFVIAFLAITHARATAAPLNPQYRAEEFKFYMEDSASKVLIVPTSGNAAAEEAATELKLPIYTIELSSNERGAAEIVFKAKTRGVDGGNGESRRPQPDDVALFLHTSGTTSKPKGVPLTHANLHASLRNIAATYELTADDRSYLVMPLFHVHGLMAGLLAPLLAGGAVVFPKLGRFTASRFWQDVVEGGATFYTAVPTIHQVLLARADKEYPRDNPPRLRFIRSCSSSLAAATLHALERAFNVPVLEAYAMTEASHQMTSNPLPKNGEHKPGSVGVAQGCVKVAILDQNNQPVPSGTIGEVCIRGDNVTSGYHNRPEANKEAYAGGWFHTGDQGWLDEQGYLTLTGRIKELINRGGEKISPLEVDGILLSHPAVAEAVSFGAPDEKYGEIVAAAVVLKEGTARGDDDALKRDITQHCGKRLAAFKVPQLLFFTNELPKGPTGKIQRRFMVDAFIHKKQGGGDDGASGKAAQPSSGDGKSAAGGTAATIDGFTAVATALARAGVKYMFGVVGIPVTQLATAAQIAGIRYIGFRNEQAAGYAAAAAGFLTGMPAALLTVSGPGAVHGLAGCSHAAHNCWPLIMLSGSAVTSEVGKGSFQECDQMEIVKPFVKHAVQLTRLQDAAAAVAAAVTAAVTGRPGAAYIDLPADVISGSTTSDVISGNLTPPEAGRPLADESAVEAAVKLLTGAKKPLVVVGKGAVVSRAEKSVREFCTALSVPCLCMSMAKGMVPDSHPLCANAARSLALKSADVVIVVGTRLNWQLHFGEPPRWSEAAKFVVVNIDPPMHDRLTAAVTLQGDAAAVVSQLHAAAVRASSHLKLEAWSKEVSEAAAAAVNKLETALQRTAHPLNFHTTLRIIRDAMRAVTPAPIVACEGANTMDNARIVLTADEPRTRLDAGTWGTMGVGLGYAIAAAVAVPDRLVIAVEGDSAFGFSGMEVETICRYNLPIVIFVFNNGGVYGGDRREAALIDEAQRATEAAGFGSDPAPTAFVQHAQYHLLMQAFGGNGYAVSRAEELADACQRAFAAKQPALIDVAIDPMAGRESGNVHSFNKPQPKA